MKCRNKTDLVLGKNTSDSVFDVLLAYEVVSFLRFYITPACLEPYGGYSHINSAGSYRGQGRTRPSRSRDCYHILPDRWSPAGSTARR